MIEIEVDGKRMLINSSHVLYMLERENNTYHLQLTNCHFFITEEQMHIIRRKILSEKDHTNVFVHGCGNGE